MRVVNAYKDQSGKIIALWRDEKGVLQEQAFRGEQSIFFKAHEVPDDLIREWRKEPTCLSMSQHGEWLKTVWQDVTNFIEGKPVTLRRWLCYNSDSPIVERQIQTYEGDVHPVKRWMIDNDIEIQRPRIAYFDLECDSRVSFKEKREMRILSYAIVGEDGVEKTNVLNEDTNEDERRLLCDFWNDVEEYDLLVAWNADGFDNEVLLARTKKRSVPIEPKRKLVLDHMRLYERMNKQVAESGDEKSSMALEAVAQAQLGEGKHDFDASKTYQSWKAGGAERERLVRYNLQDTRLLKKIEERTGYISTFLALCECMFVFPDSRGALPTEQVDSYILRLGKRDGIHFKTKKQVDRNEEHEQFLGAFVMQPTFEGIAKNVHVSDFRRLYPSVIRTWNISPETKLGKFATKEEAPAGSAWCPYTQIAFSTETKGMFPRVVDEFIAKREEWANLKASLPPGTPEWHDADRRSNSYKVAANATFGVAGTPSFRFYDREVGESITQNAKYLIEETIKFQERESPIKVKYGDTDSTFGVGVTREEFTALVKRCNVELYPKLVADLGCKLEWNDVWLAYEKEFSRVVFVSAKRYAGRFAHYKGKAPKQDSRPEIKGLEYKRGDTAKLARELQENVIRLLLGDWVAPFNPPSDDPADYRKLIEAARDHVLNDELDPEHVVLSKSVTKDLDDYETKIKADGSETDLTHIAIAKMLEKRGMDVSPGTRVFYVITDASVSPMVAIPVQDYTGKEADRFYLWENLVWPPTQRLLESAFPRENWRTYDRARPKVKRTRLTGGVDHLARQGVLFSEAAVVVPQAQRAEVPVARAQPQSMRRPKFGPIKLTIDYAVKDRLQELVAILQRHPGTRAVEIEVRVGTSSNYSLVELQTPIQCSGSPEMIAEYNAWKAASSQ